MVAEGNSSGAGRRENMVRALALISAVPKLKALWKVGAPVGPAKGHAAASCAALCAGVVGALTLRGGMPRNGMVERGGAASAGGPAGPLVHTTATAVHWPVGF